MKFNYLYLIIILLPVSVLADEYTPVKLEQGRNPDDYESDAYNDQTEVYVSSLYAEKAGQTPLINGYKRANKIFSVPVPNSTIYDICHVNNKNEVLFRRKDLEGNCYLSIANSSNGTVTDLHKEVDSNSDNCDCYYTGFSNNSLAIQLYNQFVDYDSPISMKINITQGGMTKNVDVPNEYLEAENSYPLGITDSGIVIWYSNSYNFYSYDTNTEKFKKISAVLITELFGLSHQFPNSFYFYPLIISNSKIIFRGRSYTTNDHVVNELIELDPITNSANKIPATAENLYKYDLQDRTPRTEIGCSISPKNLNHRQFPYSQAILPNGDIYSNDGYFLVRKITKTQMPYCYNSTFKVGDSCKKWFSPPDSSPDPRYGLLGDKYIFPITDTKQNVHTCEFEGTFKKAGGKPLANRSLELRGQNSNRKVAVKTNKNGKVRFRIKVDTSNSCFGPGLTGPFKDKEVHPTTKYMWAQHCV